MNRENHPFVLALDLGVFHRRSHSLSGKEVLIWSLVWISLSLVFNAVIYFFWDRLAKKPSGFGCHAHACKS
jgi:hypothetical protein